MNQCHVSLQIQSIKCEQEEFKENLSASITSMHHELQDTMEKRFSELHMKIDNETCILSTRMDDMEVRIKRIEDTAHNITREPFHPDVTIVAFGVVQNSNEDTKELAMKIIQATGIDRVPVVRALRLGARNGKSGVIKIELASKDDKIEILKNKHALTSSRDYQRVFLRSSQTHAERLIELNFKTLLKEIPNGNQFRVTGNGRLVRQTLSESRPSKSPIEIGYK